LTINSYSIDDFKLNDFVACIYDDEWCLAKVIALSLEFQDIEVTFMHPHEPANFLSNFVLRKKASATY